MRKSNDYRDYVISDGKFIGEFEEMYKNSKEIPWHQNKTAFSLCTDIDLTILAHFYKREQWHKVLDVGCGYGYVAERLRTCLEGVEVAGLDISKTAITKARELFPKITFEVGDLCHYMPKNHLGSYDCVVVKDVLWYVLKNLDDFMISIDSLIRDGGALYVCQSVPDLHNFYGREIFPDTFTIIDYFARRYYELYSSSTYERTSLKIAGNYEKDKYARFLGKKVYK